MLSIKALLQKQFSKEAIDFLKRWVSANMLGWFIGSILLDVVFITPWRYEEPSLIDNVNPLFRPIILTSLVITPVALSQWLVIRKQLLPANYWLGITWFSFNVSSPLWWVALSLKFNFVENIPPFILTGFTIGFVVGGAQWVLLRRVVRRSSLWVAVNIVASLLGCVSIFWVESILLSALLVIFPLSNMAISAC